ncbi:unnamed protein product [Musa hybrid cultivar]
MLFIFMLFIMIILMFFIGEGKDCCAENLPCCPPNPTSVNGLIRDSPSASITRRQRRGALPPRTRAQYCHCCPPTRHRRRSSSTGLPDGRHSGRTRPWEGTRPAIGSLAAASRKPRLGLFHD